MKKAVACFTLFCLFAGLWGTNVFAEEFPLGDLGNPDDYDQTIQTFSQSMSDFDIFVDQLPRPSTGTTRGLSHWQRIRAHAGVAGPLHLRELWSQKY